MEILNMLYLPETLDSKTADIKDASDDLFRAMQDDDLSTERIFAQARRLYQRGYKINIIKEKGGALAVSTKTPGTLYEIPENRINDSDDVKIVKILLKHQRFPERINEQTFWQAMQVGKTRAFLFNTISHIKRMEADEARKARATQRQRQIQEANSCRVVHPIPLYNILPSCPFAANETPSAQVQIA
jgi:hypothetical protein